MEITLTEKMLDQIDTIEQGDKVKLEIVAEKNSATVDGEASFFVEDVQSSEPSVEDVEASNDDETSLPNFAQAKEKARQEVIDPQAGEPEEQMEGRANATNPLKGLS